MKIGIEKLANNARFRMIQEALLLGGMFLLLVEIRFEHQAVLADKWQSWIPIVYLSTMLITGVIGICTIERLGRKLLVVTFSGLIVLGLLGFAFHSQGKPVERLSNIISVDFSRPGQLVAGNCADTVPPLLAPLSLVGLGTLGILASLWKSP